MREIWKKRGSLQGDSNGTANQVEGKLKCGVLDQKDKSLSRGTERSAVTERQALRSDHWMGRHKGHSLVALTEQRGWDGGRESLL